MGSVRVRLSIMMFLQYAVWGVWAVNLSVYLGGLESFRQDVGFKINMIFLTMAIASILAPFVASQLADRYFSTERFLAFSQLVGGLFLLWASPLRFYFGLPPAIQSFEFLFWAMLGHCLLYAPTVALTNSLAFHHLPNGEKDFGSIRLWGTIGWIVVGVVFGLGWIGYKGWAPALPTMLQYTPNVSDCLVVAGVLSIIMAVYSMTLPHTPPARKVENPLAFLTAIKLARYPSFAVMLVVAFLVSTELQFYYVLTPNFFHDEPGLSLSQNQLQKAANVDPAQATLLIRLLDKNNNKKLSEAELAESALRQKELQSVLTVLKKGPSEPSDAEAIKKGLEDAAANLPPGRPAEAVAGYAVTAVDDTGSKKITGPQLEKFLGDVGPLTPEIAQAREKFAANATEKGGLNLTEAEVGPVMTIGQFFEILVLLLLPLALARLGFTLTIAIGIAAWALRYALFALGTPVWLVLASQGLHGFGFGFFFVGCMIYSDRIAPKDIRASAQGLIIFVSFGLGMLVSSLVAGPIADYFENDWHLIFLAPVAILVLCTIVFLIGFRPMPAVAEGDSGLTPTPPPQQDLIGATEEQKYR
jgi:MFS family permease